MKVAQITEPYHVELVDLPDPQAQGDQVVVKILSAPMCAEHKLFKAGIKATALGHEAAGEVVEVDRSSRVKVGDRVALYPGGGCGTCEYCQSGEPLLCQINVDAIKKMISFEEEGAMGESEHITGTWSHYVRKQDWTLMPLPEEVSLDHGSMMCCGLGPSFGAMQYMQVKEGETVLIVGTGPVGLGGVINAMHRGARAIALEPNPYRSQLASELGAEVLDPTEEGTLEQIMELTKGIGVDAALDSSMNNPQGLQLALDALRRRGKLTVLGGASFDKTKDVIKFAVEPYLIFKAITLHGTWMYNLLDAPQLLQVVLDSAPLLDKQITHRLPMTRTQEAFEIQNSVQCGKVILHPWEK